MTMVTFHQKKTLLFNVRVIRDVLFHEVSVKCIRLGSSDVSDVLEIQNIDTAHMS